MNSVLIGYQEELVDPKVVILGAAQSGKSSIGNILYACDSFHMKNDECDFSICPVIHLNVF